MKGAVAALLGIASASQIPLKKAEMTQDFFHSNVDAAKRRHLEHIDVSDLFN